ncbi:hypothetical protein V6Z12_A10G084000 [Gossypium hirsutum]
MKSRNPENVGRPSECHRASVIGFPRAYAPPLMPLRMAIRVFKAVCFTTNQKGKPRGNHGGECSNL